MKRLMTALVVAAAGLCMQAAAAAGKPGGGGQILPVSLGASSNCSGSYGLGINNGGYYPLQVVGQGSGCPGGQPRAVLWTSGIGMIDLGTLGGATGGSAEGISDDGTVVGWVSGGGIGLAFVRPLGGPAQKLEALVGMVYSDANAISANAAYVVGSSSTESEWHAVRWDRSSGTWKPTAIPSGGATAVSNSGAVVGSDGGQARIWSGKASVVLPGIDTRANDINAPGTVVVGFRWQPCPAPCGRYEVPMVWTLKNGTWSAQELQALDGVDSEASGVAEVNGQSIIVGYGYTKADAVMRAVAWKPDALGKYGAPIRLGALDGRSTAWAHAEDINSSGQVVGTSAGTGLSRYTVMWKLP
jgi:probable HAF family extracellular repeat protein